MMASYPLDRPLGSTLNSNVSSTEPHDQNVLDDVSQREACGILERRDKPAGFA